MNAKALYCAIFTDKMKRHFFCYTEAITMKHIKNFAQTTVETDILGKISKDY